MSVELIALPLRPINQKNIITFNKSAGDQPALTGDRNQVSHTFPNCCFAFVTTVAHKHHKHTAAHTFAKIGGNRKAVTAGPYGHRKGQWPLGFKP